MSGPVTQAFVWGILSSLTLLVGAFVSLRIPIRHQTIARVMALGSGALLGLVSLELTLTAKESSGLARTIAALLSGAALFCTINAILARRGARHRKRCGDCVRQAQEKGQPGSGLAIAVGTVVDGIPEGLILGIAVAEAGWPGLAALAGFALANFPEGLSATAGMNQAGRSKTYIYSLWTAALLVTALFSAGGAFLLADVDASSKGVIQAVSAGLLLALVTETMTPEAFDHSPDFSGLIAVLGFALIALAI